MSNKTIITLLKTTSLVAGILALPACSPTTNHAQQGINTEYHGPALTAAASEIETADATISTEQDHNETFSVEMVAIVDRRAAHTVDAVTERALSSYSEAFGPAPVDTTTLTVYAAPFGPQRYEFHSAAADTAHSPALYDDSFGPIAALTAAEADTQRGAAAPAPTQTYNTTFGPYHLVPASTDTARMYEAAFGPADDHDDIAMMETEAEEAPIADNDTTGAALYSTAFGPQRPGMLIISDADAHSEEDVIFAQSVSDEELSTYRGAFAQETTFSADNADQVNANILTGTSANNVTANVITGDNTIDQGAINFNGVGTFLLNSGNNVVQQNSTIINLNLQAD